MGQLTTGWELPHSGDAATHKHNGRRRAVVLKVNLASRNLDDTQNDCTLVGSTLVFGGQINDDNRARETSPPLLGVVVVVVPLADFNRELAVAAAAAPPSQEEEARE